jgi:hypothetical protein
MIRAPVRNVFAAMAVILALQFMIWSVSPAPEVERSGVGKSIVELVTGATDALAANQQAVACCRYIGVCCVGVWLDLWWNEGGDWPGADGGDADEVLITNPHRPPLLE